MNSPLVKMNKYTATESSSILIYIILLRGYYQRRGLGTNDMCLNWGHLRIGWNHGSRRACSAAATALPNWRRHAITHGCVAWDPRVIKQNRGRERSKSPWSNFALPNRKRLIVLISYYTMRSLKDPYNWNWCKDNHTRLPSIECLQEAKEYGLG